MNKKDLNSQDTSSQEQSTQKHSNREWLLYALKRRKELLTKIRKKTQKNVENVIDWETTKNTKNKTSWEKEQEVKVIKDITLKEGPFYKLLDKVDKMEISNEEKSKIYDYIFCMLNRSADLKTNKKPSTANVTSIYWVNPAKLKNINNKKDIVDFMKYLDKENISYTSITNMQMSKGIPNLKELEYFINFLRQNNILDDLPSIANMQMSKGIPDLKELENFINFLRQSNILDDLPSITSMQNWKGIPDLKILWELMSELWRKGLKLKDFSGKQLWIEATLELVKKS